MSNFLVKDPAAGVTHGIDRDNARKAQEKLSRASDQIAEVTWWIETVTGMAVAGDAQGDDIAGAFHAGMKSGVVICELINRLRPGTIKKINRAKMPFMQMENITQYLNACKDHFGMSQVDMFVTKDLFDAANIPQVLVNIYSLSALSRKVGFQGPFIGTKQADKNERHFSEETLAKGKSVMSRQTIGSMGYQPSLDTGMDKIKRLDEAASKSYGGQSRQVQGSRGYQPKLDSGMDKIKRLDEAQSKSYGGQSRQVQGSRGYQPKLGEGMDKIKRLDEAQSASYGGVSRQVQGSYGFQPEKEGKLDKIKRLDDKSSRSHGGVSRQTQGSYGFQDTSDRRGVDKIVRNVDELNADRARAKGRF